MRVLAEAEMETSLVLRTKTAAARNLLHVWPSVPEQTHLRTDRAAITRRAFELETDPLVLRRHVVLVNEQRPSLIRDYDVEHAAIPKIDEGHRTSVKNITRAHGLRDVHKLPRAVVDPDPLLLITRQTATSHRRPLRRVGDDRRVAARDLREVVPVILIAIERDVAIHEIEIERAVVVQIAKLRAKTPATNLDVHCARHILVLNRVAIWKLARHPEIVSLDQNSFFRDVGNVDRISTLIQNITDRSVHAALRRETNSTLFTGFVKLPAVVDVQLRDPVMMRDEQILTARPPQVGDSRRERPATRVDAELLTDFFKRSVTEIVK